MPTTALNPSSVVRPLALTLLVCVLCSVALAQTETATVTGRITDPEGRVVPDAEVQAVRIATNTGFTTRTNAEGLYAINGLQPGQYRLIVRKEGFRELVKADLILQVQDVLAQNFSLQVGSIEQSVTVTGGTPLVNTESATVSTVVDRQFVENMPLNGRSFQALIQLTPGVVVSKVTSQDGGQFNVNGQRAASNYWTVDGVSANIGVSALSFPGNGAAGALGSFNVLGGTNSLVSVDALQEFRIQTSSYAPEFGRTPGGQISITTRSGTNRFHGTLFDYFRNDVLDANDWFANSHGLAKPRERQNDFGGVLGGPILRDRTFFFFSYEGLRLRQPQTTLTTVPDLTARQSALAAMQPFFNAYPLPNGRDNPATGIAQFNSSYSNPATLNAYSLRIDHKLGNALSIFGRYQYSPSEFTGRDGSAALSGFQTSRTTIQTGTIGGTWIISPRATNDFRFNYSRTNASGDNHLDSFGGATPVEPSFPPGFSSRNASFALFIFSLTHSGIVVGGQSHNLQRQINLVDTLFVQKGSHSLKFGADYRRLSPQFSPDLYGQNPDFLTVAAAETGQLAFDFLTSQVHSTLLFRNLGVFAQDTWRLGPRLTLTYGLRWDLDITPSSLEGPDLPALTGFDLNNLSNLALAPSGTSSFNTSYGNVAPRFGVAYQLFQTKGRQTVLRGGFGLFYDLATSEVGNLYSANYPFGVRTTVTGSFPLSAAAVAPPPITATQLQSGTLSGVDPNLVLPYTLQWNASVEQELGKQQSISLTYVGAVGRRLLRTSSVRAPNSNFGFVNLVSNGGISDYDAMQVQFQRRLSRGLQALASYVWSHSIDTGSAGSIGAGAFGNLSNAFVPGTSQDVNRGPSLFDIRHSASIAVTYDIPVPKTNAFTNTILQAWSLESIIQARSAPPVDINDAKFSLLAGAAADVRPDLVTGQPFYLFGSQFPGSKAINPAAFTDPPVANGAPVRQGTTPRNFLRGFGATQWDFAVHREFPIHESLKLQFRAEMFNVLNHPNFGPPSGQFGFGGFGVSSQTLAQSLSLTGASGAFNALYQQGGPRSIQLALKLTF